MEGNKVGFASQCHPESQPLPLGCALKSSCSGSYQTMDSGSRCLDSQSGEMPNQVWHDTLKAQALNKSDFRAPLRSGFTLIELLVVVLIIAILAAIALPQYQKAVYKSHIASVMPLIRSIKNGQEAYYLSHGNYAPFFEDLDVTLPASCSAWKNNKNMLFCNDWLFDNVLEYVISQGKMRAFFCPGVSHDNYSGCIANRKVLLSIYYRYGTTNPSKADTIECDGANASATAACEAFKGKFF